MEEGLNMENPKDITTLYFNTRDELLRVDLKKVVYFKADKNYTDVFFLNGSHLTLPANMLAIEQMLDDDRMRGKTIPFVRLGRSLIVNLSMIMHVNVLRQELVLSDMVSPNVFRLPVSREALKKLKELYCTKNKEE